MTSGHHRPQLLKLAVSLEVDVPEYLGERFVDLLVDVRAEGTAADLIQVVTDHLMLPYNPEYGLVRTMVRARGTDPDQGIRYLPDGVPLADLGLLDGVTLTLAIRSLRPAPTLHVDLDQAENDLYLIDERGTHRGRVTRLAVGTPVYVGRNPPDDGIGRPVLVDDAYVDGVALRLTNQRGQYVYCLVEQRDGWVIAGAEVTDGETQVLPGSTISFKRTGIAGLEQDDNVYVSFVVATKAALHGRSPVGRVQFDVAARRSTPKYDPLPDRVARVRAQPSPPEPRPFPKEQVIIPGAMVGALWLATHNALSLITAPIAAAVPVFSYSRQRRQEKRRYEKDRADWLDTLNKTSTELARLAGVEEGNLRLENPPPEAWALRAYRRLAGLWERDPEQEDFLHVRLGLGRLLSRYETRLDEGTDTEDRDFKWVMSVRGREVGPEVVRPMLFNVPVTRDLREHHLGIVGPADLLDHVATDLLVQVSCAHPPGAVGVAALLPASEEARGPYEWLKWLPHTRSGSTLLPSARIAAGRDACDDFLVEMQRLHAERREHRAEDNPGTYALVVVHEAAEVDVALLAEVCDLADGLVRMMWLGSSKDIVPKLFRSLIELRNGEAEEAMGGFCGEDDEPHEFKLNGFRAKPVATARALAGLYDPRSSGASAGVPQSVPLAAVTELAGLSYERNDAYRREPGGWRALASSFPVPMGLGEAGVLDLDLIRQGPHVLIGGTTGSGKSELLQSITCGAISHYSPAEISLFLIDFKGGATFAPFRGLPHVVGYVTDLDQRNVNRALDFLRAELRRRERAFEDLGNAKEYGDYLDRALESGRDDILPRLVVIFDEFATIVQDFERDTINAVIDIARRGRSWGVHLVLATQQPTRDVVVPQVRGNVNARIALRTPSPDESLIIIDRPDAAHIPQNFPGRALMTLGGKRLVEFQTAFSGAPYVPADRQAPVAVTPFKVGPKSPGTGQALKRPRRGRDDQAKMTQLQALVRSVSGLNAPRSLGGAVMLPALEEQEPRPTRLEVFRRRPTSPTTLWLGRRDLPKQQRQDELVADLGRGGLCLIGPNRSGITTALVTVAESFGQQVPPGTRATVISFDAANHLRTELDKRFENTVSLSMTRLDEITRCIDQLWFLIRDRMADDGGAADSLGSDPPPEAILLLIDGLEVLMRTLNAPGGPALWAARLAEVLTLGRRAGVYSCISVRGVRDLDRSIITSQAMTIALHGHYDAMSTPQDDRLPGYGTDPDGNLVQFFIPSPADGTRPRFAFDHELAERFLPDRWRQRRVSLPQIRSGDLTACLGVEEIGQGPFRLQLAESHLLVIGSTRSGRTKLLLTLAEQLEAQARAPVALFSPRGLPPEARSQSIQPITADQLFELSKIAPDKRMAWLARLGVAQLKDGRTVLLADDCQAIEALENSAIISRVLGDLYKQSMVQPVAVTTAGALSPGIVEPIKKSGVTLYLRPTADRADVDNGYRVRGITLRHRPGMVYKAGDVIIQTEDTQFVAHLPELERTGIMP
jgi:DNA segregation ATPase FtsK/SpoIIIE, S-DNA-T family